MKYVAKFLRSATQFETSKHLIMIGCELQLQKLQVIDHLCFLPRRYEKNGKPVSLLNLYNSATTVVLNQLITHTHVSSDFI
jgi:hypothetical protein